MKDATSSYRSISVLVIIGTVWGFPISWVLDICKVANPFPYILTLFHTYVVRLLVLHK